MSNQSNLELVKQFVDAAGQQDKETLLTLVSDDFEWTVPAPSFGMAPNYGAAAIDALLAVLGGSFAPGEWRSEIVRTAVDGSSVVLEVHVTAKSKTGKQYDNWYVHWFELKDNLITLWREHSDTKHAMDTLMG